MDEGHVAEQGNERRMHPSFLNVLKQKERVKLSLAAVKHKVGIYSAKGGVGKTTIAVNLSYTLMSMGFKVGLLDADIDCPNIGMFLGTEAKIEPVLPLVPVELHGMKIASTAMIVDDQKRPIIWRGPIIAKMLGDFLENTAWGELDYLVIDLGPGTSDAPLTTMQLVSLDGFVLVTTPQRIAAINSLRSGLMAKRLSSSIVGVVENMSDGTPSNNTVEMAAALGARVLGCITYDKIFNTSSDKGEPAVASGARAAAEFRAIAERLVAAHAGRFTDLPSQQ